MPSRREQIRMSADEARAFLDEERTVTCATIGREGRPHLMPLWYVVRDSGPDGAPEIWAWTFAFASFCQPPKTRFPVMPSARRISSSRVLESPSKSAIPMPKAGSFWPTHWHSRMRKSPT